MVKAFSEEDHPDYDEYKKWLGIEVYNAEKFDIDFINKKVKEMINP